MNSTFISYFRKRLNFLQTTRRQSRLSIAATSSIVNFKLVMKLTELLYTCNQKSDANFLVDNVCAYRATRIQNRAICLCEFVPRPNYGSCIHGQRIGAVGIDPNATLFIRDPTTRARANSHRRASSRFVHRLSTEKRKNSNNVYTTILSIHPQTHWRQNLLLSPLYLLLHFVVPFHTLLFHYPLSSFSAIDQFSSAFYQFLYIQPDCPRGFDFAYIERRFLSPVNFNRLAAQGSRTADASGYVSTTHAH